MLAILEHGQYQEILRPPIYKTQKFQDQKRCHAPPHVVKKAGIHSLSCTCQQTPPSSNQVHSRATCIHAPQLYDVTDVVAKPGLTHSSWLEPNRLQKKKPLTMVDFDQKVKIFKTNLSHLVFRVHYNFGIRFFIQNSEIAQTSNFQKSWFFHKFWQKVKIFKKDLSCPIFCVDSNFGVYFFIWESKISQIVWFYIYWLWCELWACPIQIFAKILILKSTYLFWTWKPPIWPTSLKY